MSKPEIVSPEEWQKARDELLVAEKEATRALDALAARRRRLPMVRFANDYTFTTATGTTSLLDLFEGRNELVTYQFMNLGPDKFCGGCTWLTRAIPPTALEDLAARGISWANISDMPIAQIEAHKQKQGWTIPFVSSEGTTFAADCVDNPGFVLSFWLRDGDEIYRTYSTVSRGVDRLILVHNILDLTAYGRREAWEDSPAGWPQS